MTPLSRRPGVCLTRVLTLVVTLVTALGLQATAQTTQSASMQQKVQQVQQAMAHNQQMLSQYTWQTQQTVSVNGDVKSSELYQEQLGPNGQPVKVALTATPSPSGRHFGVRHRISEDYQTYAKQIAGVAQSYAQPNPQKLQQLYAQGNVALKSGGAPGTMNLVISNYVKQGDSVTLSFNQAQKALMGINVNTYNSGPSDVVTMTITFAKLPDGTNHVATLNINGQSKNMVITQQNMNYQKRPGSG